jgi:hypothetical protein
MFAPMLGWGRLLIGVQGTAEESLSPALFTQAWE